MDLLKLDDLNNLNEQNEKVEEIKEFMTNSIFLKKVGFNCKNLTYELINKTFDKNFDYNCKKLLNNIDEEKNIFNYIKLRAVWWLFHNEWKIGNRNKINTLDHLALLYKTLNLEQALYFVQNYTLNKMFRNEANENVSNIINFRLYLLKVIKDINSIDIEDYSKSNFLIYLFSDNGSWDSGIFDLTYQETLYFYEQTGLNTYDFSMLNEFLVYTEGADDGNYNIVIDKIKKLKLDLI